MAITPYSGTVPNRLSAGDNEVYATQVYNWLIYLDGTWVSTVNSTEANINAKEASVVAKEAIVVAKEALMNPHYTAIDVVYANVTDINAVATDIIPNLPEILQADTNAATATTKAAEALSSANAAATSETNAYNSELAAAALLDSFDDRYLGVKAVEPTLDNDGNPLVSGALYYNTTSNTMFVYDLELTTWISLSFTPTDHGSLTGLVDDDHAQYHNDTRGDARYYTKSANDTLLNAKQDTLVSGTNIKSINGESVLGSGDIAVGATDTNMVTTSTSITMTKGSHYNVTTSGLTLTLPTTPTTGDKVVISVGDFSNTTVARNGQTIGFLAENLTIDRAYITIELQFLNSTWRIV